MEKNIGEGGRTDIPRKGGGTTDKKERRRQNRSGGERKCQDSRERVEEI